MLVVQSTTATGHLCGVCVILTLLFFYHLFQQIIIISSLEDRKAQCQHGRERIFGEAAAASKDKNMDATGSSTVNIKMTTVNTTKTNTITLVWDTRILGVPRLVKCRSESDAVVVV
jgi:hypothetical protein